MKDFLTFLFGWSIIFKLDYYLFILIICPSSTPLSFIDWKASLVHIDKANTLTCNGEI